MYSEFTHELEKMNLPNVVFAHNKGTALPDTPLDIHPVLKPLILKLAKARPKWLLVGERYAMWDNTRRALRFAVVENGESLGTIKKEYAQGEDKIGIDNKRLSDMRQRGHITATKDVNKAFKIITKQFHGKTVDELMREAQQTAANQVSAITGDRNITFRQRVYSVQDAALAFALHHWDEFATFAREQGVAGIMLDTFHEAKEADAEGNALGLAHNSFAAGGEAGPNSTAGHLVVLRGNDYLIQRSRNETTILTSDDLTPHLRRSIGMLKLTEKGTFVPGIGVKSADNVLFVMPEQGGANHD